MLKLNGQIETFPGTAYKIKKLYTRKKSWTFLSTYRRVQCSPSTHNFMFLKFCLEPAPCSLSNLYRKAMKMPNMFLLEGLLYKL